MTYKSKLMAGVINATLGLLILGNSAVAQDTQSSKQQVITTEPNYSEAMRRLLSAAQRLRESTHAMAANSSRADMSDAIRRADQALLQTQQAMLDLPPELRQGGKDTGVLNSKSLDRLKEAAQQLRRAAQAMAEEPAGPRRNEAIRQTNRALLTTQQAMLDLFPDEDSGATTGAGAKEGPASGGSSNR